MRRLLLALPFALLPLAASAHEHHDHDHGHHDSLGKHEHGVAELNLALDGQSLEIELDSPAVNLVGFEHAASSDADKARLASARASLEQPLRLFNLPAQAACSVLEVDLESPLFGNDEPGHHGHSDIEAEYKLHCAAPDKLASIDLGAFFSTFPGTEKLRVQLIGPNGQHGAELTPDNPRLKF